MKSIERRYEFVVEASREEVFGLLSDARNLNKVTPPWFNFEILSENPGDTRDGMELDYWLSWRRLRMRWRSRVTAWDPPHFFAYEQAKGPFGRFLHEHYFVQEEQGTRVVDRVIYRPPGGRLSDRLLVAGDLARIFSFRERAVAQALATGHQLAGSC